MSEKKAPRKKVFLEKYKKFLKNITVEPVMFVDGLAYSIMTVFVEDLQMRRICEVSLNQNATVCSNLAEHHNVSSEVQVNFSVFAFYDGIIKSAIPLFFILFMGAWSDKYGRKVPLFTGQFGHAAYMLGLLLFSVISTWPVEYMLIPSLLQSLGGGNMSFLTAANAYISDVTSEKSRTSRVGLANGIYFLGGPTGTFIGKFIYHYGGYAAIFSTSFVLNIVAVFYILFFLDESHGPYAPQNQQAAIDAKKPVVATESLATIYGIDIKNQNHKIMKREDITLGKMVRDFVNPRRLLDSFKSTFKRRDGNTRVLILLVIFCNVLRKLSRSPYVYAFTRHVLSWEAEDYSLWITYKNLMGTIGSLVAVPLLSGRLHVTDHLLGIIGAFSGLLEYFLYGMVVFVGEYFFWIAPVSALLINSCTIAQRAMLSKLVTSDELGKVSAVLGAVDGVMPMVNISIFVIVYRQTVTTFPAAHFFLGAAASGSMIIIFLMTMSLEKRQEYDFEKVQPPSNAKEPVVNKSVLIRTDSMWLSSDIVSLGLMTSSHGKGDHNSSSIESEGEYNLAFEEDSSLSEIVTEDEDDKTKGANDSDTKSQASSDDSGLCLEREMVS